MSFNHYVPAWLLRNFVASDGKISILDLLTKSVSRQPVGKIGGEHGLYEFVVPQTDPKTVENYLQLVESDAARPIKKLLRNENTNLLTDDDRRKIANFISVQSFRTKAFFAGLPSMTQSREVLFNELLRSSKLAEQEIFDRRWYLLATERDHEFYIGDHPVALQHSEAPNYQGQLGWDLPWTEAYLPLTPKRCLWIPPMSISLEIVTGYQNAIKLLGEVQLAAIENKYHLFAGRESLELLHRIEKNSGPINLSFETGCLLSANQENIVNANSLQILFSGSHLFSRRGDFEFAKMVLEKTPEFGCITATGVESVSPVEREGSKHG